MQFILRDSSDFVHHAMTCSYMDAIYDDYLNNMVPDETRSTIAPID